MTAAAISDFLNFKFLTFRTVKKIDVCHRAKFHKNRLNPRLRYGDFYIFQDGGHRHLGLSKFEIFNVRSGQEGRTASLCQIWILKIFNGRNGQEGGTASVCQISSKSFQLQPRYVSLNILLLWLENAYSRPYLGFFVAHSPK